MHLYVCMSMSDQSQAQSAAGGVQHCGPAQHRLDRLNREKIKITLKIHLLLYIALRRDC